MCEGSDTQWMKPLWDCQLLYGIIYLQSSILFFPFTNSLIVVYGTLEISESLYTDRLIFFKYSFNILSPIYNMLVY